MKLRRLFGIVAGLLILAGCASEPANNSISWQSIKSAAHHAATSKHTWVPLLGAALFQIDDWDQKTVDWASTKNPLFGNRVNAQNTSDDLNSLGEINMVLSTLLVPSHSEDDYLSEHTQRLLLEYATLKTNSIFTIGIKNSVGRERPDGSNFRSFPSGHASGSAAKAALSRYNISLLPQTCGDTCEVWQATTSGLAMLTSWARVEGQKHYPSDVLAGYALGNFVGQFVSDGFIRPLLDSSPTLKEHTFINLDLLVEKQIYVEFAFHW